MYFQDPGQFPEAAEEEKGVVFLKSEETSRNLASEPNSVPG